MDSSVENNIKTYIKKNSCTFLGIGPMSLNCVDSAIEIANDYNVPFMFIASRRQIDSDEFGGGYVNNWTTKKFADYVRSRDKHKNVLLARDHGGPWQNNKEISKNFNLKQAMDSAKISYKNDIDAGFEIIHIDPSIDIHKHLSKNEILERLFELYEFCNTYSKNNGKEIIYEIGTEEQSGTTNTQEDLDETLISLKNFCQKEKLKLPSFVVIQTGTKVMEMKNVGTFDSPLRVYNEIPSEIQVPKMIEICDRHQVLMKEHNTDYLSDTALAWHPRLGIHSANVAPEFGVAESRSLLKILRENNLNIYAEKFLELSYNSKKWEKWMLNNTLATDEEKSLIAGHYIFSTNEFLDLKNKISAEMSKKSLSIDNLLCSDIKKSILRYMHNFRVIK